MGTSAFLNAFRILRRKPMLLLLLIPLHAAVPLAGRLLPSPDAAPDLSLLVNQANLVNYLTALLSYLLGLVGITLLLYLVAGFFLIPPAMELLQGGAEGEKTAPGWYGRGLKKHWWKPVSLGVMEVVICIVLAVIFSIFISLIQMMGSPGLRNFSPYALNPTSGIITLIVVFVLSVILYFIISAFALLLPAMADRDFNEAFRAVFSGFGFKKTMKVLGAFLMADIASSALYSAFGAVYLILNGSAVSLENLTGMYSASWTAYCASVLMSFSILFKYAYVFSVFGEIKLRESQAEASGATVAWRR